MNLSLIPIPPENKEVLADLLIEYQKELLGKDAPRKYKYLDTYWGSEDRLPFFIVLDGKRIGFVLVNKHTLIMKNARSIAEFYVIKEFRKRGVGKETAIKIFDMYPGNWELREMEHNLYAQNYWRKIVNDYTNGNYSEEVLNNELWKGPVQMFDNSK